MKNVCWQLPNVHIIVFKKRKSKLESSSRVDIIKHQRLPKELDRKGEVHRLCNYLRLDTL